MEQQDNRKEALRQRIEKVLSERGANLSSLSNKTIEEVLEEVSIYHQELEFQNLELRRIQEELEASERHFEELFSNAPVGYVVFNSQLIIQSVNHRFGKMLGIEAGQIKGTSLTQYIHPDYQDQLYLLTKNLSKIIAETHYEFIFQNKLNQFTASVECNFDREKEDELFRMAVVDISEQKRIEKLQAIRLALHEYGLKHNLNQLLQKTLDEIEAITGSSIGFYHFLSEDKKTIALQAWSTRTAKEFCNAQGQGLHYSVDLAGVWVDCIHEKKPIIHNDYAALKHKKGMPEGHAEVIREMVVPVFRDNRIVAILGVANKPTYYNQADIETVSYLADVAWEIVEKKRLDEEVERSNQQVNTIFESISDAFFALDDSLVVTYFNNAAEKMLSCKASDVLGKPLFDSFPEARDSIFEVEYSKAIKEKKYKNFEVYFPVKPYDNWYDVRVYPQENGISVYFQVITERKKNEIKLQEKEEYLRTILQTTTDGFWVVGSNRRMLDVNQAYLMMVGYTREEFLKLTINDIDAEENPGATAQRIERIIINGSEVFETRHRHRDGSIFDVEVSATFLKNNGDQFVCFCRNITERKKAEKRVNLLANMLDNAPGAISVHDMEGNFLYTNYKNLEYHGYTHDELMAINLHGLDVPESEEKIKERIEIIKKHGEASFEVEHFRKDGSRIPLLVYVKKVDWYGKPALFSIGTDLTERKTAEEALIVSNKNISLLAESAVSLMKIRTLYDFYNFIGENLRKLYPSALLMVNSVNFDENLLTTEVVFGLENDLITSIYKTLGFNLVGKKHWINKSFLLEAKGKLVKVNGGVHELSLGNVPVSTSKVIEKILNINSIYNIAVLSDESIVASIAIVFKDNNDISNIETLEAFVKQASIAYKRIVAEEKNNLLVSILDRSNDFVGVADINQRVMYVNPAGQRMVGLNGDEDVKASRIEDYFMPEDLPFVKNTILPTLMNEGRWFGEFRFRHFRTGKPIPVLYDLFKTINPITGEITNISTVSRDITQLKLAEQALIQSENNLSDIFNTVTQGIAYTTLTGQVISVNQALEDIIETPNNQLVGKNILRIAKKLLNKNNFKIVLPALTDLLMGKNIVPFEVEFKNKILEVHAIINQKTKRLTGVIHDITQRKLAEKALKESEHRFQLSMEATNDGLWDWDVVNDKAYYSPAYYTMLGYKVGEFPSTGNTWLSMVHPGERDFAAKLTQDCIEGLNESFELEYRMRTKHGDWYWLLCRGKCVERDRKGKAIRLVGTHVDITERKEAENEILKRELLLNKIFDVIPIGLWFTDEKGKLLRGNPAGVKIWGAEPTVQYEEYGVFKARRLPSGEEIEPADWALAHTITKGVTITDELIEIDAFDGQKRVILNYTAPVLDNEGNMLGAIVVNNDITELQRAQEALKASEQRLRTISDNMFDLVSLADLEFKYTFVGASHEILGYDLNWLIGRNIMEFVHPNDMQAVTTAFSEFLNTPDEEARAEYRYRCADGSYVWFETVGRFILDENSEPVEILFNTRDFSARKKMEDNLKESEEKYRTLFESMNEGVFYQGKDGQIIDFNQAALDLLGLEADQLKGRTSMHPEWNVLNSEGNPIPPEKHPSMVALSTGNPVLNFELGVYNPCLNAIRWLLVNAIPQLEENGEKPYQVFVTLSDITAIKRTEEVLKQKNTFIQTVLDNLPIGVALNTINEGHATYINKKFTEIYGWPEEELRDISSFFKKVYPDEQFRKELMSRIMADIQSGDPERMCWENLQVTRKDGTHSIINAVNIPLVEQNTMVSTVMDVTKEKLAEQALRESEERFRGLYENATVGIYRTTPEGRILMANPTLVKMLGYDSFEELAQRDLTQDGYEPDYKRENFINIIEEKGEVKALESEWKRKDGTAIFVSESARVVRDNVGKHLYYEGIVEDITERRRAIDALRASEERISSIFRVAPTGIGVVKDRVIIEVNPRLCVMTGYNAEELIGQSARILYPSQEEFEFVGKEKYRQISDKGTGTVETKWLKKNGSVIDVLLSSTPIVQNDISQGVTFTALDITRRKQMEITLKNSEEKFRLLFENMTQGFALHEVITNEKGKAIDYRYLDINPAFERLTGLKANDLMGRTILEVMPNTEKYWIDTYGRVSETGESIRYENYSRELGKYYDVSAFSPQKGLFAVVFSDVTERKRAEETVQILTKGIEQSPAIVVITDIEGNIEYVNQRFTEVTGYSIGEAIGLNPRILKSGLQSNDFYEELWSTILSGQDWKGEMVNKRKNGETYWESAIISPIMNENGKIVHFIAIKEDITEDKRIQLELEKQHRLINTMLDNLPIGIFMVDAKTGRPLITNEHAKKLLGKGIVQEATTETLANVYNAYKTGTNQLYPTEELPIVKGMKGIPSYVDDMEVLQPDGTRILLEVFGCPVQNDKGGIWASLIGFIDITERKKAELALTQSEHSLKEKNEEYLAVNEELAESYEKIHSINKELVIAREKAIESDRLKTAFLANMSHEIRTPMNAIIGFSELLLNPSTPSERREFFTRILNTSCHHLLSIVDDVIDIAKIETGQMEIHEGIININEVISRIQNIFSPQAAQNNVTIKTTFSLPNGLADIVTDSSKLNQILNNLVGNAVKFTEKGYIEVGYKLMGEKIEFYVSDTGIGIRPEHHGKIFERFQQVEMDSNRKYGGTGLGLPICKALVEMLGGSIWLTSEFEKGTTFYFSIPYNPLVGKTSVPISTQEKSTSLEGITILVAEDEDANFIYLNEVLQGAGAEVIHATNGVEAIDIFRSIQGIDIILMDIKMPKMDGISTTRAIRTLNARIPIVALTAYALSGDREKCLAAGCNSYISKPILKEELLRVVASMVWANR